MGRDGALDGDREMIDSDRITVALGMLDRSRDGVKRNFGSQLEIDVRDPPQCSVGDHHEGPSGSAGVDIAATVGDVLAPSERRDDLALTHVIAEARLASIEDVAEAGHG